MPFVSSVRGNFGLAKRPFPAFIPTTANSSITGGTITTGGGYRIHTFSATGASTFSISPNESRNGTTFSFPVEFLVVAAGGAGGGHHGGGGGGGGVAIGSTTVGSFLTDVVVGAGVGEGLAVNVERSASHNGGNSSFGSVVGIGGGAGQRCCTSVSGVAGGSSGGWGAPNGQTYAGVAALQASGTGYTGYGNASGGVSTISNGHASSGGGGAGSVGGTGSYTGSTGCRNGSGGNGIASSLSGSSVTYGGGGGGGQHNGAACYAGGFGGSGGGGNGPNTGGSNSDSGRGVRGTDGLGGGGGGDSHAGGGGSGGGNGVVIVRYLS